MKDVANYIELHGSSNESLLDHRKPLPKDQKEKVLRYLKTGKPCGIRCSLIYDYVGKYQTVTSIYAYTDGEYHWDSEDIYHFWKYDIELDSEFIDKIMQNRGVG